MKASQTVGGYLIEQLGRHGVRHVFGVPGDYVLTLFRMMEESRLEVINTCDEQGAGFAADAYARVNGLGAVCVTYCVGGLKVANTTAQAFAEKSPVVVVSGAPGTRERVRNPLLHHKVRDFDTQARIFRHLTVASAVLDDPQEACRQIDRVLGEALRFKQPVYIEVPRDMAAAPVPRLRPRAPSPAAAGAARVLKEALAEAQAIINGAERPVVLAGVEIHRFGLQEPLRRFLEKTRLPVAATLLGKSVVREDHPGYLGVYEGAMGRPEVRRAVESSDCLIMLGTFMTDVNLGIFTARLDPARSLHAISEKVSIRHHQYEGIGLAAFLDGLTRARIRRRPPPGGHAPAPGGPERPGGARRVSVKYLFRRLNAFLAEDMVVVADPGDAMFGAADMTIRRETEFLSPAYYTSLGFAVPASLGVQLANRRLRPVVLVGDGAFQMSGMELSTVARYGLNPIVVVLNNQGYGTERPMLDGAFNDVLVWSYARIPEILGAGKGFDVLTEQDLDRALDVARAHTESFSILDVHLAPDDISGALQRLTANLRRRV